MTKLEIMLEYVSEHNDFYKKRIKDFKINNPLDIKQWPILTREELQKNRYFMFSDGYKAKYYSQLLRRQASSGSSGVPINVYWDYKDWYVSNLSLWRKRSKWYGIKPSDKSVMFTLNGFGIENDGKTVYTVNDPNNILIINVSLLQFEKAYKEVIDIINDYEPKWLYIQPHILNKIIQTYEKIGMKTPKSLSYIESVGEMLAPHLQRKAEDTFKVPVINMYGSEEMNGIAIQNPYKEMQIIADNVYVEVMNNTEIKNKGSGCSIITNLNNKAMPLIRYCQDDIITIDSNEGKETDYSIIHVFSGRKSSTITLENGFELTPYVLMEVVGELNNIYKDIICEYSFVYYKKEKTLNCIIRLEEKRGDWELSVQEKMNNIFRKKGLGEFKIRYCFKPYGINVITESKPKENILIID